MGVDANNIEMVNEDQFMNLPSDSISEDLEKEVLEKLPILNNYFRENKGQLKDDNIRYYFDAPEFGVAFTESSIIYRVSEIKSDTTTTGESESLDLMMMKEIGSTTKTIESYFVTITYPNSNSVLPSAQGEFEHVSNYFYGNDPSAWVTEVGSYSSIVYHDLYQGIDLRYYFTQEGLKYEFVVKPQSNPSVITMDYSGIYSIETKGNDLILHTPLQTISDTNLFVYTENQGNKQQIDAKYIITGNQLQFDLAEYDTSKPLIIDPIVYSTYMGGNGDEHGYSITVDSLDNIYVTGDTASTNFITQNAFDGSLGGSWDAVIFKLGKNLGSVQSSTYLGGSGNDHGTSIALDYANNIYITGVTDSIDFPAINGYDSTFNGGLNDAFIAKLGADGVCIDYSSYIGGDGEDKANSIVVDGSQSAYVTGYTFSLNFPLVNPRDATYGGNSDIFVSKFSPNGVSLVYSTYFGATGIDVGNAIVLDSENNMYITGHTDSSGFTMVNPYDPTHRGGYDVFVFKLTADGLGLPFSTFIGGSLNDIAMSIQLDSENNVYITGYTESPNYPVVNAYDSTYNGGITDVFISKLNSSGSSLLYSTFIGGSFADLAKSLVLDSNNNMYVAGYTYSNDFPMVNPFNDTYGRLNELFVFQLSASGSDLLFSTYVGGIESDFGWDLVLDSSNNIYVTGYSDSSNFPVFNGWDTTNNGLFDIVVLKLDITPPEVVINSPTADLYATNRVYIDYTVNEPVQSVYYYLDNVLNTLNWSNGDIMPNLSDGAHNLTIVVVDLAGHTDVSSVQFTIDTTNPLVRVFSPEVRRYDVTSVELDYTISDANLKNSSIYFDNSLDNSLISGTVLTNLTEGTHNFTIVAFDLTERMTRIVH
ncbi:MAG: SBBP repeat-containing protein, partial [Candidatus Heimdallarchaeota archaeon]|nr:SBBP repeat-containing protein [Candidatus Heimdallarchaeota archaeon]